MNIAEFVWRQNNGHSSDSRQQIDLLLNTSVVIQRSPAQRGKERKLGDDEILIQLLLLTPEHHFIISSI